MPSDYARVEKAILWLQDHYRENPGLDELAHALGLSPTHTRRLFRRWAGITPNQFIQFLSVTLAKRLLRDRSVLDAALGAGLSSPGRLHDRMVNIEAVTPGEFKSGGEAVTIRTGTFESPFGPTFIASTERGILRLAFTDLHEEERSRLRSEWPGARFETDARSAASLGKRLFQKDANAANGPMTLLVKGTNFQIQVWKALLRLEPGRVASYQALARTLAMPGASRAVGNAVGANPIAFLIPCHRVILSSGAPGHYHWGPARKQAMLAWDCAADAWKE